jgi:hypothetical protein
VPADPPANSTAATEPATAPPSPAARRPAPEDPPAIAPPRSDWDDGSPAARDQATTSPVNASPWGGDDAASNPGPAVRRRHSKWKADEALRQEAARFAVWGNDLTRRTAEQSAETGRAAPDDQAATRRTTHSGDLSDHPAEPAAQTSPQ